jgi:hypothetical protein
MSYLPQPDSFPARVCAFFAKNPEDDLAVSDIRLKFDLASARGINIELAPSVAAGLLSVTKKGMNAVYSAGPRLAHAMAEALPADGAAAPAGGGFHAWLERNGQPSAEGRPPTNNSLPAPDSLVIESGVPIPATRSVLSAQYAAKFAEMKVGDCFKATPPAAKRLVANALTWGKPLNRKFVTRQIDATTSGVWRTQ